LEEFKTKVNATPDPKMTPHLALSISHLEKLVIATKKLQSYCYTRQDETPGQTDLRSLAIEYLGKLDCAVILRPLVRMKWIKSATRLRVVDILAENRHGMEAFESYLMLSQVHTKSSLETRIKALDKAFLMHQKGEYANLDHQLLVDTLKNLGGDGEPEPSMQFEAAQILLKLGETGLARPILLVLNQSKKAGRAVRSKAKEILRQLPTG
jgi:hypothetical protein